jgi:peroxiredoxin
MLLPLPLLFAQAESRGPAVGASIPPFTAVDSSGKTRDLASLTGPKGLWLLFFRSADW